MQDVRLDGVIKLARDFDTSYVHGLRLGLGSAARPPLCMYQGAHNPAWRPPTRGRRWPTEDLLLSCARLVAIRAVLLRSAAGPLASIEEY